MKDGNKVRFINLFISQKKTEESIKDEIEAAAISSNSEELQEEYIFVKNRFNDTDKEDKSMFKELARRIKIIAQALKTVIAWEDLDSFRKLFCFTPSDLSKNKEYLEETLKTLNLSDSFICTTNTEEYDEGTTKAIQGCLSYFNFKLETLKDTGATEKESQTAFGRFLEDIISLKSVYRGDKKDVRQFVMFGQSEIDMLINLPNEQNSIQAFIEIKNYLNTKTRDAAISQCSLYAIKYAIENGISSLNMNIAAISILDQHACLANLSFKLDKEKNLQDLSLKVSSKLLKWGNLDNSIILIKHLLQETDLQAIVAQETEIQEEDTSKEENRGEKRTKTE
eukprot:GHVP01014562.1.p1 GENE.GHVP01014562.1~~GHVP01014562.1.p1  ORF type:complete len:338 (+),score=79.59 GHVP01014562.1:360-1373(+)